MTIQFATESIQVSKMDVAALESGVNAPGPRALLDRLLRGMARSGLGIAAISEFLGMTPEAVEERAAALDLPRPHDRPMRKAGPRGWSVDDVQRFIALWMVNVATKSIAAAIGRSNGSLYYKRKWLGLEARRRSDLRECSAEECGGTPYPWVAIPIVEKIAEPIKDLAAVVQKPPKREDRWNKERSKRCSYLAFAGLSNSAIAAQLTAEFGVEFREQAVADQLCRLQVIRDRSKRSVHFIADEEIEPRAEAFIVRWGLQLRTCVGSGLLFWYSRVRGGPRHTCRVFQTRQKYAKQRQERDCAAHFGVA